LLIEQAESCRREMRPKEPLQGLIWQYFGSSITKICIELQNEILALSIRSCKVETLRKNEHD